MKRNQPPWPFGPGWKSAIVWRGTSNKATRSSADGDSMALKSTNWSMKGTLPVRRKPQSVTEN